MVERRSVLAALIGAGGTWVAVAPSSPVDISLDTDSDSAPEAPPQRTETVSDANPSETPQQGGSEGRQYGSWDPAAAAKAAHEATNEARTDAAGLSSLSWSDDIARVAEEYANRMAEDGFFSHTAPDGTTPEDRFAEAGVCYRGENISQTWWQRPVDSVGTLSSPEELGQSLVDGWMDSDAHRENILRSRFDQQGIGIAKDDSDQVFAVQNFC